MTLARSAPVLAIALMLVLFPFLTTSGDSPSGSSHWRVRTNKSGMSTSPDLVSSQASPLSNFRRGRLGPLLPEIKRPTSNQIFFNPAIYPSGGVYAFSVAVGDFNGDGNADLAVANECPEINCNTGAVSVLLGNGDGTFQVAQSYSSGGYEAYAIAVGDVNNDGKADLIVTNGCQSPNHCANGVVGVLLGNGDGTFRSA